MGCNYQTLDRQLPHWIRKAIVAKITDLKIIWAGSVIFVRVEIEVRSTRANETKCGSRKFKSETLRLHFYYLCT